MKHAVFSYEAITDEVKNFNSHLKEHLSTVPKVWDLPVDVMRNMQREGNAAFPAPVFSPRAYWINIPGRSGSIRLRIIPAPTKQPNQVYLRFHGGGWVFGAPDFGEPVLEVLSERLNATIISVEYRLSPEHPFPAAPDDCEDAALWLLAQKKSEFHDAALVIGGESAGAHLAVLTLLRLKKKLGVGTGFSAANLIYGCYDLSGSPSLLNWGDEHLVIDTPTVNWLIDKFAPTQDRKDPKISPLYADLSGLPPALFTVGTLDPLLDDSLFMYERWRAASYNAELAVYPGGIHGFHAFPFSLARLAQEKIAQFLAENQS